MKNQIILGISVRRQIMVNICFFVYKRFLMYFYVGPSHLYIRVFLAYVRTSVRVRKLMEAESAMTMKIKVASLYE